MRFRGLSSAPWILLLWGCTGQYLGKQGGAAEQFSNQLVAENSPYLLRHAHDPVDWMPLGAAAIEKARQEDRLLLIYMGDAASYECRQVQKEIFADTSVAGWMNRFFVPVLADRQLSPDAEALFVDICNELDSKDCNWPMCIIALPDGSPVYASGSLNKVELTRMAGSFYSLYEEAPEQVRQIAEDLRKRTRQFDNEAMNPPLPYRFSSSDLDQFYAQVLPNLDLRNGGLRDVPKVHELSPYFFLLDYYYRTQHPQSLEAVTALLDQLSRGGIYDQLGGGFARGSFDEAWHSPRFEKLLPDNARLISLYARAYQLTRKPLYEQVVYETSEFLRRELRDENGGYYASLDAVSENENGRYYLWPRIEIDGQLGKRADLFSNVYNITRQGNTQRGQNILYRSFSDEELAAAYGMDLASFQSELQRLKDLMWQARSQRKLPARDRQELAAWNSLMICGWIDAYRAFGDETYLQDAIATASFMEEHLFNEFGQLSRQYMGDNALQDPATLEDYSYAIEAFVQLYQVTFQEKWLQKAEDLVGYALTHFYHPRTGLFFSSPGDTYLTPARRIDIRDRILPDANAVMCRSLYQLGYMLRKDSYLEVSRRMLLSARTPVQNAPAEHATWASCMAWQTGDPAEVLILGEDAARLREEFDRSYHSNVLVYGGRGEGNLPVMRSRSVFGQTVIYLCQEDSCEGPYTTLEQVEERLMAVRTVARH